MPENRTFLPEGLSPSPEASFTLPLLQQAAESGRILEAPALRCDMGHALHFSLDGIAAVMPREEAVAPWVNGAGRDIAVLSRVGKPTCFRVLSLEADGKGAPRALLSRRLAQEAAMEQLLSRLTPGSLLTCAVTHLEPFGAFLDVGCGIVALLPTERISVSRISHPGERFREGQKLPAVVLSFDRERRRITLTHRELWGTWLENASRFAPGETVPGIVRSVQPYGSFVELTPNLSGLVEAREGLRPGDAVAVFIRSIRPERMKIKLQLVGKLPEPPRREPFPYQITDGRLSRWVYSPPGCEKLVETAFTADGP